MNAPANNDPGHLRVEMVTSAATAVWSGNLPALPQTGDTIVTDSGTYAATSEPRAWYLLGQQPVVSLTVAKLPDR